jgi:hypothetical protein
LTTPDVDMGGATCAGETYTVNVWHAAREDLQARALTSRADLIAQVCLYSWLSRLEVQAVCCWSNLQANKQRMLGSAVTVVCDVPLIEHRVEGNPECNVQLSLG